MAQHLAAIPAQVRAFRSNKNGNEKQTEVIGESRDFRTKMLVTLRVEEVFFSRALMSLKTAIYALWYGGMALEALLLVALIARRMWRRFPRFATYCAFTALTTACLYVLRFHTSAYSWTYWILETIGVVLGFSVVYEVFDKLFSQHPGLRKLASTTFRWAVLFLVTVAFVVFYMHSSSGSSGITTGIRAFEEAARIVEVGVLLTLFVFASAFGLHWRQHLFGIALGLGLFTAVELAATAMRVQFGISATPVFNVVRMSAYNLSLLVWIGYMLAPERVTSTELPKTAQLEQWNEAIMELIHQ